MKNNKSFTLIELLVVIVIIGILAGVIAISTSNNIAKAQDSKVSSTMLGINKLLKTYSMDTFPIEATPCNIKTSCTNLKSKIDVPNIDQDIYYKTSSSGNFFVIYANKPSDTSLSFEINSNIEKIKEVPSFDNLVAYYPLSIGTSDGNTISDMSPNSNNGTNNGATFSEGVDGNMNSAMKFDGNDDYISIPHATSIGPPPSFTFITWIKINILEGNYRHFADKWVNSSPRNGFYLAYRGPLAEANEGKINFQVYNNDSGKGLTSNSVLETGKWYMIAATINTNQMTLEIWDKNKRIERKIGSGITIGEEKRKALTLGAQAYNYGQCNAILTGIRLYNKALSESEITILYNNDL
ncbi:MAG: LamG-like jellyroll fold domain-containing protein [Minisyncoccales bacterium]|jgi:prepilin-type N-terminal cleavage/methylation domain-containing protein